MNSKRVDLLERDEGRVDASTRRRAEGVRDNT